MRKRKIKKGFTLIELIVVIAVLGILVLLAGPKLLGYTDKAQLTRIQHDTKVMEQEMEQVLIEDETKINSWDNNGKELGVLVMQEKLFEKEGVAKSVNRNYDTKNNSSKVSIASADSSNLGVGGEEYGINGQLSTYAEDAEENDGDGYKIVPNDYKDKIKTKLKGTFYTNDNGKVYYENDKPLKVDKDVGISCESPEALPDYEFDHATGTITKWNGSEEHLVIPFAFKNADTGECTTVRIIGKGAFMQGGFKSVVIPDTVVIIRDEAFKDNELTEVNIPHSVTEVGNGAFEGNNLTGIHIPHSVVKVGDGAFDNNNITAGSGSYGNNDTTFGGDSATGGSGAGGDGSSGENGNGGSVNFEHNGNKGNESIAPEYKAPSASDVDVVFNTVTGTIVSGKTQKPSKPGFTRDEITIPNEINVGGINYPVKEIAKGAYQGLGLKSVVLPTGLERIGDYAFAGNQLVGITVPEKVSYIGHYAFAFNEQVHSDNKVKKGTIKTIKMQNGAVLEEQFSKLDTYGNIQSGGIKIDKIGIVQLKEFIFVTSIDNHVIDDKYVGSNPITPTTPILPEPEKSHGIYIDEKIAEGYTPISTAEDLNAVRNDIYGKYIQTKDIDLSGYSNGTGWEPIGYKSNEFRGTYDGGGFKIAGLAINRPSEGNIGLFGHVQMSTLENIGIENASVMGKTSVGVLVGIMDSSSVLNSYSTGLVEGKEINIGGLIGYVVKMDVNNSTISNSYSTASVKGSGQIGGLVGQVSSNSIISGSYATGSVRGSANYVGGLAGVVNYNSTVSNSYSTGFVVSSKNYVGGLVGYNNLSTISNSYSTGLVTGSGSRVGGLIGYNTMSTPPNSYYDTETAGKTFSDGGTGKTTSQMKSKSTYVNWEFDTIWQIEEGVSYPTLRQQK